MIRDTYFKVWLKPCEYCTQLKDGSYYCSAIKTQSLWKITHEIALEIPKKTVVS